MKKVLVLLTVLALASMASAVLQISVNGVQNPVDSEIVVVPSGSLTLDIWTTTQIQAGIGEGYYALVVDSLGSITGGESLFPNEPGIAHYFDPPASMAGIPGTPEGADGVWGSIIITGIIPNVPANGTIIDNIEFHCEGLGDALISLVFTADFMTGEVVDTVLVHQVVPEPMTIALLGLGGLLLRKRS